MDLYVRIYGPFRKGTECLIRNKLRSAIRRIWPPNPKPLILMYHRIADEPVDPWRIAVSPTHFEEHLDVVRRTRHPLSLSEFIRHFKSGTLPLDALALTFDDGYADNLAAGKPRLVAADVSATVFLATGYLDRPGAIWSDELARLVLLENGPANLELTVRGQSVLFELGTESPAREDGTTPAESLVTRRATLWRISETLRVLEDEERAPIMAKLRSIFGNPIYHGSLPRAMTSEEVQTLVADGLVTIGAHTVTHPVLPKLEPAACRREIRQSKIASESLVGAPVAGFAYPYGDFNDQVREAVRDSGFAFACSVQCGPVVATSDAFALPRIYVGDWDGDAFQQALRSASA